MNQVAEYGGSIVITELMNGGKSHPTLWFWLFWIVVIWAFIYPLCRLIYSLIKKARKKDGIKKN
jgi:hypothetical protein